jgi:hypothetical protein
MRHKELYVFIGSRLWFAPFSFDFFHFLSKKQMRGCRSIKSFSPNQAGYNAPFLSENTVRFLENRGVLRFNVQENKIENLRKETSYFFRRELSDNFYQKNFLLLSHFDDMTSEDFDFLISLLEDLSGHVKIKFVLPFSNFLGSLTSGFFKYMSDSSRLEKIFQQRIKHINDYYIHVFDRQASSLVQNINLLLGKFEFETIDLDLANVDREYLSEKLFCVLGNAAGEDFNFKFDDFKIEQFISPDDVSRIKKRFPNFEYGTLNGLLHNARNLMGHSELAIYNFFKVSPFVIASCKIFDSFFIDSFSPQAFKRSLYALDNSFYFNYFDFS